MHTIRLCPKVMHMSRSCQQKCTSNNQLHQGSSDFQSGICWCFIKFGSSSTRMIWQSNWWHYIEAMPMRIKGQLQRCNHAIWPKSDSQLAPMGNFTAMECLHGNIKKHSIMKQCTLFFAGDTYAAMSIGMPKSKWSLSRLAEALNPSCKLKCYLCRHVHYLHTTKPTHIKKKSANTKKMSNYNTRWEQK